MIIQDQKFLRQMSKITTIEECNNLDIWNKLEQELKISKIEGVGLSAVQIGFLIKALIIRIPKLKISLNIINPVIINQYDLAIFKNEGCLSFPNQYIATKRYKEIEVKWQDDCGENKQGTFLNHESAVLQHEIDHLNGILFWDRRFQTINKTIKVGRNDPCPCNSGKKYKKCCMGKL